MENTLCLKGKKILLATGGSGGHLSPALAMADVLREQGASVAVSYDYRTRHIFKTIKTEISECVLPLKKRRPGLLGKFFFLTQLMYSFFVALRFMFSFKPNLIIGFGGYASSPVILCAMIRGMPLALHEQNAVLGRVNRLAARSALFIATSFAETREIPPKDHYKVLQVGNPVQNAFYAQVTNGYTPPDEAGELRLLIIGGSQGSAFFDRTIPASLTQLPEVLKKRLVIFQQVRMENHPTVQALYDQHKLKCTLRSYFDNLPELIQQAHFVIGRAGSSTVFELLATGRPGLLIPLLNSKDNHQYYNAQAFQDTGGGVFLEQKDLTPERLSKTLISILLYPHLLQRMHEGCLKHRQARSTEKFLKALSEVMCDQKDVE
jgi:UDP-N-acetylglucosamine--N-acetylmuramyl-(pentapeptide) pyrophosphoryl-undecaprenol N-acetylglucosamine transferase